MPIPCRAAAAACLFVATIPLAAQDEAAAEAAQERARHVAEAIRLWCADYETDKLGPSGPIRRGRGLQPGYVTPLQRAGVVEDRDFERLTHLDALQKAVFFAEMHPAAGLGDAVLDLAAVGFDKSLIDRESRMLRDLGHWTLVRMDHQGVWFLLMRAAAGEELPFLAAERTPASPSVARQVAALKVLGTSDRPLFRSTLQGQLLALDPRVRLAASEALEFQRRADSLPVLVRALGSERHPVVSLALARALVAVLTANAERLDGESRDRAVRAALRTLGQAGWRTDMELVDLAERYPSKAAIPELIAVLERTTVQPDRLVELVNRDASPRLRARAHEVLRGLTGALIPADQPRVWREFWQSEREHIVVPEKIGRFREVNTRAEFFGIPVTGREIAFLIDTSGSMDTGTGTAGGGGRGRRSGPSRLDAAREQMLLAVQAMDPTAMRFHLITFDASVWAWTKEPVKPDQSGVQNLTRVLGRLRADGGTNVFEALVQSLALEELRYGQESSSGVDEVFLLSDGMPTVGMKDPDEILAAVAQANRYLKVRIHTVFTGTGKGSEFLRMLAEQNDGVYVQR